MADVKSGVNYEITATDKTSATVKSATDNVKKATKEAGEAFQGEFNPMSAVLAGISGNTEALAQQMLGLASRMKNVHMTMMKFSIYAAIVMAVVKAVQILAEAWKRARVAADNLAIENTKATVERIVDEQRAWNQALEETIAKTERTASNIIAEIDATEKLTNAQLAYNKALEISLAKNDEEKEQIERKYSLAEKLTTLENERARIAERRSKQMEELDKLEETLRNYEQSEKELRKQQKSSQKKAMSTGAKASDIGYFGAAWNYISGTHDDDLETAENASAANTQVIENILGTQKAIEDLKTKIATAKKELSNLADQSRAIKIQEKAAEINAETAERDAQKAAAEARKKAEAEAKAKEEAEKAAAQKIAEQRRSEMQRAAEAEAKAIEAAQLKANKKVMEQRRKDLAELTALENNAAARVSAAQAKVAEAWGWYRNKDSMAAQLKEEKAEAEARKQFEKDFEDLKFRRDWRTAKDLSVDEEAVRRVALAKEEETAAQKALAETAASTAKAAASLAQIEKVITQEG